jgi:ribosomal protein S1
MKKQENVFADATQTTPAFDMEAALANFGKVPVQFDIVSGIVTAKVKGGFLVDIGLKADAFAADKNCEQGLERNSESRFMVIQTADSDSEFQLSQVHANHHLRMQELVTSKETVTAQVTTAVERKGSSGNICGMNAFLEGRKAFIPRQQLGIYGDPRSVENTELPVKVIKAEFNDRGRYDLVLSHAAVVDDNKAQFISQVNVGDELEGTICHLLEDEGGVLVNVGVMNGIVRRRDLSFDRHTPVSELAHNGDAVTVEVINVNHKRLELTFSIKTVAQRKTFETLKQNQIVEGKVQSFAGFGTFILVGETEGLLHKDDANGKKFSAGEKVYVRISAIDANRKRLSLSCKGL